MSRGHSTSLSSMAAHGQHGSDAGLFYFTVTCSPLPTAVLKMQKFPITLRKKTYREGQGCKHKAQVGQYVIWQSSRWSCRGRPLAESTKYESWKGKCAESGLSRTARQGTWGWKENPLAGGNGGKPGGKDTWSDARWVQPEECSPPPPAAWSSTPMKTLLFPSRSEKQMLRENMLGWKCSLGSVKMTWKYRLHFSNSFKCL